MVLPSSKAATITGVITPRGGHVGVACVCEHCGWVEGGGGGGSGVCLVVELKVAGGWRWMKRGILLSVIEHYRIDARAMVSPVITLDLRARKRLPVASGYASQPTEAKKERSRYVFVQ
jgi:hypothetical protein